MKSTACLLALVLSASLTATPKAAEQSPSVRGTQDAFPQISGRRTEGFYSYYTRLKSGETFEPYSRVGDAADIVVNVGGVGGRLVFWRGTSYLPCWETGKGRWPLEEMVPRRGDGPATMPDRVNLFSHAEIIESTASKVMVHWRYLSSFTPGNPRGGLDPNNFVEEVFTVTPDGRITRMVKQGTKTIDEWNDPLNQTTQVLQLSKNGVTQLSRQDPRHSVGSPPVIGNPETGPVVVAPCAWLKFNEGEGDTSKEAVSQLGLKVPGHKTLWKRGVSGTALQFDGYHTVVALPAAQAPKIQSGDLTLEGWFALGAYPWNWAPIVQQGDDDGYFLGVDSHGYPGFMVKVGGVWHKLSVPNQPPYTDANHLALFRWYHVAGTYNQTDGMMRLYINGQEVASQSAGPGGVQAANADVRVGKAGILRVPTEALHDTLPSDYGLDGLVDEVRIYNVALSASQVAESYQNFNPGPAVVNHPDLQPRALPNPSTGGQFKAIYTHLPYYETWENLWRFGEYPDVVVGFDQLPIKFVFWRGVSYVPMLVNESNQWYNNEFNETGGPNAPGDNEPMSDKGCWNSHARIIENTPARVVVHWQCWLSNPDHHWANYDAATGWGDISDWYYYIYPDGVAVKRMRCYTSQADGWYEWQETIAVLGEGQHPESVIEKAPALTLVDEAGKAFDYNWNPEPPAPDYKGKIIHKVYFTGQYDPFTIQRFNGGDVYSGERNWYSVFPSWNHWPTAQANSSGRNATFPDRAAHSSLTHVFWPLSAQQRGAAPFVEKTLMEGMTDQSAVSLVGLAKSWLQAPPLETLSDCRSPGYDASQRAYVLSATGAAPSFRIAASPEHPIVNLCCVVRNWNSMEPARPEADPPVPPEGGRWRQGIVRDQNGRPALVTWLEHRATSPVTITLRGAKPDPAVGSAQAISWAAVPRLDTNRFAAVMTAADQSEAGIEYFFECAEGPGHSSGWQAAPVYRDSNLAPNAEFAYRVKARDLYFAETPWSPVQKLTTPPAPQPVIWNLNEGAGTAIKASTGQHEGIIHGTVTWVQGVEGQALHLDGKTRVEISGTEDLRANGAFTWTAWIRTTAGGPILARAGAGREWAQGGKVLFVNQGHLQFDAAWVGAVGAETPVADGQWHHVAVTVSSPGAGDNVTCFVDGRPSGKRSLEVGRYEETGLPVRFGFCNENFPPGSSGFVGDLDDLRWFSYALRPEDIQRLYEDTRKK